MWTINPCRFHLYKMFWLRNVSLKCQNWNYGIWHCFLVMYPGLLQSFSPLKSCQCKLIHLPPLLSATATSKNPINKPWVTTIHYFFSFKNMLYFEVRHKKICHYFRFTATLWIVIVNCYKKPAFSKKMTGCIWTIYTAVQGGKTASFKYSEAHKLMYICDIILIIKIIIMMGHGVMN